MIFPEIIEGLQAPEFKSFSQIKSATQILGKEKALSHYNYIVYQLQFVHYAD